MGDHRGMGDRQLTVRQCGRGPGQRAAEQGPGGPDRALGGAGAQAEPVPKPGGGGPGLLVLVGPGGAAGVHGGQFLEPVAFEAVDQPPQGQDPLGQRHVVQAVEVLGCQPQICEDMAAGPEPGTETCGTADG